MPTYRFSIRDPRHLSLLEHHRTLDGAVGFVVEVQAETPQRAVTVLKDALPDMWVIPTREYVPDRAERLKLSAIRVYFYPETITEDDIEETL